MIKIEKIQMLFKCKWINKETNTKIIIKTMFSNKYKSWVNKDLVNNKIFQNGVVILL